MVKILNGWSGRVNMVDLGWKFLPWRRNQTVISSACSQLSTKPYKTPCKTFSIDVLVTMLVTKSLNMVIYYHGEASCRLTINLLVKKHLKSCDVLRSFPVRGTGVYRSHAYARAQFVFELHAWLNANVGSKRNRWAAFIQHSINPFTVVLSSLWDKRKNTVFFLPRTIVHYCTCVCIWYYMHVHFYYFITASERNIPVSKSGL